MIEILYEHPAWFARLFEALDARQVPYRTVHAAAIRFVPEWKHDPSAREAAPDLLINRMSPSADRRGHGHGILATLQYLESMEAGGVRVINGTKAYGYEISKPYALEPLITRTPPASADSRYCSVGRMPWP